MTMHQSNVEEIINFTDALVFAKTGKYLSDLQKLLFQVAWFEPSQPYHKIALEIGYSVGYIERDAGPKLWHLLSDVLGVKVKKSNFRAVIERFVSNLEATAPQEFSLPTPSDSSAALQNDKVQGEKSHVYV